MHVEDDVDILVLNAGLKKKLEHHQSPKLINILNCSEISLSCFRFFEYMHLNDGLPIFFVFEEAIRDNFSLTSFDV